MAGGPPAMNFMGQENFDSCIYLYFVNIKIKVFCFGFILNGPRVLFFLFFNCTVSILIFRVSLKYLINYV